MLKEIAVVRDYDEFHQALRNYVRRLNTTYESIGLAAEFSDGYVAKLLSAAPTKGIGPRTLGPLLKNVGLVMILAQDIEAMPSVREALSPPKRIDRWRTEIAAGAQT